MLFRLIAIVASLASMSAAPVPRVDRLTNAPQMTCYARDKAGHTIKRSRARRNLFRKLSGYPHGRPGYVVDHIVPLCAGGCDEPRNMMYQSIEDGKDKDAWERALCAGQTKETWDEWRIRYTLPTSRDGVRGDAHGH